MPGPVVVCPGQGAQAVGMGQDLAAAHPAVAELFQRADDCLGLKLSNIIFEGPEEALKDTANQQPALVLMSLASLNAWEITHGKPLALSAAAGLSLGEYAALAAAGALSFETALTLVRTRGRLMAEASQANPGGMAVVLKMDAPVVEKACADAAAATGQVISACNYNGGGQIVIGGTETGLEAALANLKAAGAKRLMKLPVSGAFHTALMEPAVAGMREALEQAEIRPANVPVYANATARPVQQPDEIRAALLKQLTAPVLWEQSVLALAAAGHATFWEFGAGTTVSNMIKRILPEAETRAYGSQADFTA